MAGGLHIRQKRSLHIVGWLITVALIVAVAVIGWYTYRWYTTGEDFPLVIPVASANPKVDESDISQSEVESYTVPPTHPRYISIPALDTYQVRVMKVGIDSDNILESPSNINDTAWYEKSATPGLGYGAVLIDGHNGGRTKDGVFARLGTLRQGATISIERGDGKTYTYSVVSNVSMSLKDVNNGGMQAMLKSPDESAEGLSLITCDGNWVPQLQQFDRRIMLRAVLNSDK